MRFTCFPSATAIILGALLAPSLPAAEDVPQPAPLQLEPFEVTGSRIKRVSLEGPSPIEIITRADIELSGATALADALLNLPEMSPLTINEGSTSGLVRGATALDLRGLGPNNTLVLIDGRRIAPNGISGFNGVVFVDPNRVPLAMVERVEILKDGASSIYGTDATSGVINIVMRKNFNGLDFSARYGNYSHTDGAEQAHSLIGGLTKGKVRVMVGFAYSSRHANAAVDEPFSADGNQTERWRAYDPVKYAAKLRPTQTGTSAFDFRSSAGPYALVGVPAPGQLAAAGLPATATTNPLTGAPYASNASLPGTGGVPAGTIGGLGNYASVPFGANSGRPTAAEFVRQAYPAGELSNSFNLQPFVWNVPARRMRGATASFDLDLAASARFYAGVSTQKSESETHQAPAAISTSSDNNILVPATNYYNPFGIPVAFLFRPIEFGSRIASIVSDSRNYLAGFHGSISQRFDWELGWAYSANDYTDTTANALSESRLRAALAKTTPEAFNIFGGPGFKNNPATIESIRVKTSASGNASTATFSFHVSTPALHALPWGDLGSALAVERRIEHFNAANDLLSSVLDDIINQGRLVDPTRAARTSDSIAAELRIPLVREGRFRYFNTLELSTAGRIERFSSGYNTGFKPSAGLRFRPTPAILLRASYSEIFRAPSMPQLFGGSSEALVNGLADPRRPLALTNDIIDSNSYLRTVRTVGNPRLLPEDGRTKQVGLVIDPPWKWSKGLSLDFTHGVIEQAKVITLGLSPLYILQNELGNTGDLVMRDPGTETYTNTTAFPTSILSGANGATTIIQPGQTATVPGRIKYVLNGPLNFSRQIVRYDDFGVRYKVRTDLGNFSVSSTWTYYEYLSLHRFATDPWVSNVGRSMPRYRGRGSATWQRQHWNASLGMTYTHRYSDLLRDGWEVKRYYEFSSSVGYHLPTGPMLKNASITLGLDNLFNRQPPIYFTARGYNQGLISRPGGRFGFISFRESR